MADTALKEQAVWEDIIRMIETTDTVIGGEDGVPNIAPGQLANRTQFLKAWYEAHINQAQTPDPHPQYITQEEVVNLIPDLQFQVYNSTRKYHTGEVCYTKDAETGELAYWQWYSNVESLAGKSPLDKTNRHEEWTNTTKPFYWIPYTGDQVGVPFYWLDETPPEWAVMEINVNLPIAVYWRLARRYPKLVHNGFINTGEIRAEFIRVADQGRGVDSGRVILSAQADAFKSHNHATSDASNGSFVPSNSGHYQSVSVGGRTYQRTTGYSGGNETRPRNVARPMAIVI